MGEEEQLESAVVNAIERLIDAKMWVAKVEHNDQVQLFHAGNELQGARYELAELFAGAVQTRPSKEANLDKETK